jgi:hypothetical protein
VVGGITKRTLFLSVHVINMPVEAKHDRDAMRFRLYEMRLNNIFYYSLPITNMMPTLSKIDEIGEGYKWRSNRKIADRERMILVMTKCDEKSE